MLATFNKCCNPDILEEYFYTENGVYRVPLENILEYVNSLPNNDLPEVFGLNGNAQVILEKQTSELLLHSLLKTQPKDAGFNAESSDKTVFSLSKSLSIPEFLDSKSAHSDLLILDSNSVLPPLSIFLFQEVEKFNKLLKTLKESLKDLRKAIKGKIEMTDDLNEMYSSLLNSSIPKL